MTRPTILDLDDVAVVPREATEEMIGFGFDGWNGFAKPSNKMCNAFRRMLSASPYSSAWQEVREYVAGLEREINLKADFIDATLNQLAATEARIAALERHIEELQAKIDPDTDCACSYDEAGTVCTAHSPRVRELEKRLADADVFVREFAATTAREDRAAAARAWKEGK